MTRSVKKLLTIGLLATAPLIAAACTPQIDVAAVEQETRTDLAQNGINGVDTSVLTLKQLQEIKLITGSGADRASKQRQIDAVLGRAPGSQAE